VDEGEVVDDHAHEEVQHREVAHDDKAQEIVLPWEGKYKVTWKRDFKLLWREAGLSIQWIRTSRLSIKKLHTMMNHRK